MQLLADLLYQTVLNRH